MWSEREWKQAKKAERLVHACEHGQDKPDTDKDDDMHSDWWRPIIVAVSSTTVVGVIIWLIQLNAVELLQEQRISQLEQQSKQQTDVLTQQSLMMERTVQIVARLEARLEQSEQRAEKHASEAEGWKRRILLNEHRLGNGQK